MSRALFQWSGGDANHFFLLGLRPDQFNFREHGSDRPCFCGKQKKTAQKFLYACTKS